MSIEIKSDILAKELNQGIVPLGVPKAYQYDAALVEAARAAVNQGLDDVAEAGATATININTLGDKILAQMKHGYGYPFTAANAAAMTDTAKIYVYTGSEAGYTNGNWYYWNGTAWTSGGVYNATALETDKTLTVSGAAADAKVVGTKINPLFYYNDSLTEFSYSNLYQYSNVFFKAGKTYKLHFEFDGIVSDTNISVNISTVNDSFSDSRSAEDIIQRIVGAQGILKTINNQTNYIDVYFYCSNDAPNLVAYFGNDNIANKIYITEYSPINITAEYEPMPLARSANPHAVDDIFVHLKKDVRYIIKRANSSTTNSYASYVAGCKMGQQSEKEIIINDILGTDINIYTEYIPNYDIDLLKVGKLEQTETIEIFYNKFDMENLYPNDLASSYICELSTLFNTKFNAIYTVAKEINFEKGKNYVIRVFSPTDDDILTHRLAFSTCNNIENVFGSLVDDGFWDTKAYSNLGKEYCIPFVPTGNAKYICGFLNNNDEGDTLYFNFEVYKVEKNKNGLNEFYINPVINMDFSDPTIWDGHDGYFYAFSSPWTFTNRYLYRSSNLSEWSCCYDYPLDEAEISSILNNYTSGLWAPDVIKIDNYYLMYIALVKNYSNCKISVFKSRTPYGKFKYISDLTNSIDTAIGDSIDPEVVVADDGNTYLFFGSTARIYRLHISNDGLSALEDESPIVVAGLADQSDRRERSFEGVYLYHRNGYWYMFVSSGEFGNYTYALKVGRAKHITDDFVDKNGNRLLDGYGTKILSSNQDDGYYGPGHNGEIFTAPSGKTYMFYHCHSAGINDTFSTSLGNIKYRLMMLQEIMWDDEGWPYFENGKPISYAKSPLR